MSAAKTKDAKGGQGSRQGAEGRQGAKEDRAPKEAQAAVGAEAAEAAERGEGAPEQKEPKERRPERPAPVPRLQVHYRDAVVKQLMQQFGYKTSMQVPRIEKIVLNMGVGEAVADKKIMDNAVADMTKIAGQKPLVTAARKSIAVFKIREGYPVGCKVTLRGRRMYEFLDRLVSIAMPRIRDFRGHLGPGLRRPRQLQHGRQGTDHFPRDRVRQDRRDPGHEHHHHHHGKVRQRGESAARGLPLPVQKLSRN